MSQYVIDGRVAGLLKQEKDLFQIDDGIREFVTEMQKVPGFASYGASCTGHLDDLKIKTFGPSSYMGFIALPNTPHFQDYFSLILQSLEKIGSGFNLFVVDGPMYKFSAQHFIYDESLNLSAHYIYHNDENSGVIRFSFRKDYGILDEKTFNQELATVISFYADLADSFKEQNLKNGFKRLDFAKTEVSCSSINHSNLPSPNNNFSIVDLVKKIIFQSKL